VRLSVVARWELPHGDPPLGPPPGPAVLELRVTDAHGRPLLQHREMVVVAHRSNDGDHWLSVRHSLHLRLPERRSYRFQLQLPEAFRVDGDAWEIEWLQFSVEDGRMIAWPVTVLPLAGAVKGASDGR
jgi:hypothetical protein